MNPLSEILNQWQSQGIITPTQQELLEQVHKNRPVSLHTLLRNLLYLGVLLFTTGAGMLIYLHIDTIGHDALIIALALLTLGCFYYTYRHSPPFSLQEITAEGKFVDLVLLLGAMLFLSLEGYLHWRYAIFGTRFGLATFLPSVVFLFCAYRFDHRGVLSMGLTALASWVGLSITPFDVLTGNNFGSQQVIHTGIGFSIIVGGISLWLASRDVKKHFTTTYLVFTGNLFFVAALAGVFTSGISFLYTLLILAGSAFFIWYARQHQSFVFLLMAVLYGYIAFTYLLFSSIDAPNFWITFGSFYFLASAAAVITFVINYKKWLKK